MMPLAPTIGQMNIFEAKAIQQDVRDNGLAKTIKTEIKDGELTATVQWRHPPDELSEAIRVVEEHANNEWKEIALAKVKILCKTRPSFTADDFWEEMAKTMATTHENRAYGSIIRKAMKEEWCERTNVFVKSKRAHCHSMDIPRYKSLLFQP